MIEEVYLQMTIILLLALAFIRIGNVPRTLKRVTRQKRINSLFDQIIFAIEKTGNPKLLAPIVMGEFVREIHEREQEVVIKEHYLNLVSLFLDEISSRIIGEPSELEILTESSPFILHKEAFAENLELVRQSVWKKDEDGIYNGLMKIISLSITGQISDINLEDPKRRKLLAEFASDLSDLSRKLIDEDKKIATLDNFLTRWSNTLKDQADPELIFIVNSLYYMTQDLTRDVIHIDVENLRETLIGLGHLLSKMSSELPLRNGKSIFLTLVEIHTKLQPFII